MNKSLSPLVLATLFGALCYPAYADCSASQNCALCNSGNFTVQCVCKDSSGYTCVSCTPPNPCTGTGCCCGIVQQGNTTKTYCSSFSCGSSASCTTKIEKPIKGLVASLSPDAIAEAFQSIAQDAGPKILDLNPDIEIANTPGSGIEISNFKLDISSEKISGATYTIRNVSDKSLIAFSTMVDFYWNAGDKPCVGGNTEDAWFLNGTILQPGEAEQVKFSKTITPIHPTHLTSVVVNLQYANFSDGSVTGQNSAAVASTFNNSRKEKFAVQQEYTKLIRSGMPADALSKKLQDDIAAATKSSPRRTALIQMYSILHAMGSQTLMSKISETPSVPLR